jgi:hypothetical protein
MDSSYLLSSFVEHETAAQVNPTYLYPRSSVRSTGADDDVDAYAEVVEQPEELGVETLFESFSLGPASSLSSISSIHSISKSDY